MGFSAYMLAATAIVFGASATAQATVLYQTGFESPTFATGNINTQNGWTVTGGGGNMTINGTAGAARTGSQFVFYDTATTTTAAASKFAWKPINRTALQMGAEPKLDASVWIQIAPNGTTTADSYAGFDLYNVAGDRIAAINFNNAGAVVALNPNGVVTPTTLLTASLGVYHQVDIAVNYVTKAVTYSFDGTVFATSVSATATTFGDGDLYAIRIPSTGTGGNFVNWDDLSITSAATTPEPATASLVVATGFALLTRRRRD